MLADWVRRRAPATPVPDLAVRSDMTRGGRFGEAWLLLVGDEVLAIDGPADGRLGEPLVLPLAEFRNGRAEPLVGGGVLLADAPAGPVELLRFSCSRQAAFSRAAAYLNRLADYRREVVQGPARPPQAEEGKPTVNRCPRCGLVLGEATTVCPACLKKHKVVLRLLAYMKPSWQATALAAALMLLATFANLIPPYLTRPLIDRVLSPTAAASVAERLWLLNILVIALLAVTLGIEILRIWQGRIVTRLATQLAHRLRMDVYSRMQLHSLRFFDKHKTGGLMSRVGQDTHALEEAIIDGVPFFLSNILMLLGIGGVLVSMNWRLTLLILLPVPAVMFLSRFFWGRFKRVLHRFWHTRARLNSNLNESITGVRVVKAFAQEHQEITRFSRHSLAYATTACELELFWATFFPIMTFIMGLGSLVVWFVGGRNIIGGGTMTLGTLLTFAAYLGMFYGPLRFLSRIGDWLARALASAERIFEIIDTPADVPDPEQPVPMPAISGAIELRAVTFGYEPGKPVLNGISLAVRPGEMVGLVGKSGVGKSTTINLICRLYDVQEGAILVDGADVRRIRQEDLRRQIGVVLQDTFLFNDTILENIRYARPSAGIEDVMAAAKAANAHDFIAAKPDGYDTLVGERGTALSAGERQRVAIARAILHNPRILILDEATSSVDTDTEKQIQDAIGRLTRGRTTIAIAHRLSTLRNADRLVVLKDGRIAEMGTHDELMQARGEFHRLVEMQQQMSTIIEVT